MNFRNLDLNLLRVLDAMLVDANTTRVAAKLGLSQPAISAGLSRLRGALSDPLFVREGNVLVPTEFARGLQIPVRAALDSLEAALSQKSSFDPATCTRSFVFAASDFYNEMLMPDLAARLTSQAPNARLKMLPPSVDDIPAMLASERFDLVMSIAIDTPDWIEKERVIAASNIAAVRAGHPRLRESGLDWGDSLPIDLFCEMPQAIFSVTDDFTHFEDEALRQIGRKRNVAVAVPSYFGVARIAAQSDLLCVLPARFALRIAKSLGLSVYRLPFPMPLIGLHMYWRKRDTTNPEHAWFRETISDLLEPLDEEIFPVAEAEIAHAACSTLS